MDGADAIDYIIKNKIEGVIIECGVCDGNFEDIWIRQLIKHNEIRDLYLYDTFKGMTEPTEYDYTCEDAKIYKMSKEEVLEYWKNNRLDKKSNGWCYASLDKVKIRLGNLNYPKENIHYVVGDVLETLKDKSTIPEKIAILRLDTDWYESSKFELEQMYNNVVTGGVIIFDDYLHWEGQRKATDDFFENLGIKYKHVDIGNNKTTAIIKK